jgi:Carbohydrate binding module (family 6)/Glycosyl hydrolases family 43
MLELDSKIDTLGALPAKGLKEGPYMFERNGIYYLTYPHVENKIERLEYAIGDNPLGPFKVAGALMDESPSGCWTNHHSIIEFKKQWYLFYHDRDYSPKFDKARSIRLDSLTFNSDGTIKKVIPTLRGAGLTNATQQIQIDRYTQLSESGVAIDFLDTLDRFKGWKTTFTSAGAWAQYNSIDFGKKILKTVTVNAQSEKGGTIQLRLNSVNGPLLAEVNIPPGNNWVTTKKAIAKFQNGVQHLFVVSKTNSSVAIDWVSFE